MIHHANDGKCQKCQLILDRYPGFYKPLRIWFEELQRSRPDAHISCAGRSEADQDALFMKRATRARWGESAHNWNCALDLFVQKPGLDIYDPAWFKSVIGPAVDEGMYPQFLTWYGSPHASFPELPHVEVKSWQLLIPEGHINLVT